MQRKLLNLIPLLFVFMVSMISCADEEPTKDISFDTNGFILSYTLNDPESVLSRSTIDVEEGEDRLNSFYLLFFENSSGGTGTFMDAIDLMPSSSVSIPGSGNLHIEIPEDSPVKNAEKYNMLICGNIDSYTGISGIGELISFCNNKTENEVTRSLLTKIEGVQPGDQEETDNTKRMLSANLPMAAKYVKEANANQVSVELIRTVSRFDVFCEASGYELYSASVWNAYTEGFVWEGNFTDYTALRTERYYGVKLNDDDEKEITGSLYAFENYVSEPIQNDKVTTCLIIGLKNTETEDIEYFRTNVNASNDYGQQLKRNNVYRTIIKNVLNKGDENERGAYENNKFSLDIDVNKWIIDDSGNIQVDGDNVLAIPTSTAKLFTQGETREYYVYTIGQGVPQLTGIHLPEHIKATLTLAPGYSEKSTFKKSILTFKASSGTTKDSNETYKVEIAFSTLNKAIAVEQREGNPDFLHLNPSEMVEIESKAGQSSEDITVTSSGEWVAEILKDNYFSFVAGSRVYTIQGNSGDSFNIYSLEKNVPDDTRYWFVRIYLKDNPEISQNLVIAQKGGADPRYVELATNQINMSSTATSASVVVRANSTWEAEIIIEKGTKAGFNNTYTTQKLENQTSSAKTVYIYTPLNYSNTPTRIIVKVTVKGTDISEELLITQPAYYSGSLFVANSTGYTNLVASTSTNYTYYVYNLGENMRNTSYFGAGGTFVDMPGGGFDFKTVTAADAMKEARILQFVATNTTVFNEAFTKHKEDPSKLWIFSSNSATTTNSLLNSFRGKTTTGYVSNAIVSVSNTSTNYREFYQGDNMEHSLIKYLLDGPAGPVNPDEVQLQGYSTAGGIKEGNWPSTFIPIIKSTVGQTTYCVFGIDPVHRLILIMDPSIFGATSAASSSYPNRNNYVESKTSNVNFLNNFIAWMAQVSTEGESFLQQFQ